jgi:hypothetical protein
MHGIASSRMNRVNYATFLIIADFFLKYLREE